MPLAGTGINVKKKSHLFPRISFFFLVNLKKNSINLNISLVPLALYKSLRLPIEHWQMAITPSKANRIPCGTESSGHFKPPNWEDWQKCQIRLRCFSLTWGFLWVTTAALYMTWLCHIRASRRASSQGFRNKMETLAFCVSLPLPALQFKYSLPALPHSAFLFPVTFLRCISWFLFSSCCCPSFHHS